MHKTLTAFLSLLATAGLMYYTGPALVAGCIALAMLSVWLSMPIGNGARGGRELRGLRELRATAFHSTHLSKL